MTRGRMYGEIYLQPKEVSEGTLLGGGNISLHIPTPLIIQTLSGGIIRKYTLSESNTRNTRKDSFP